MTAVVYAVDDEGNATVHAANCPALDGLTVVGDEVADEKCRECPRCYWRLP